MKFVLKYKSDIFFGVLIVILYFALRLPNLTLQPIFADEAIYIRWAQVMRAEPTLRFLPLIDGKTPLFMWSMIPLLKVIDDPLFAGRFLSVLSGFATMIGVFALAWKVFSLRVALWSALIYAIVPYTVFFDRMALVDSMLASFTIWALFFAIWLLKSQRLDLAMILGYLLGGALLTKTPAMVNLIVLPLSVIGFNFKNVSKYNLLRLLGCWIVAILIALTMYNLLRLGPEFHKLSARNADYIFTLQELSGRPLDPFIPHFGDIANWFPKLFTWPVLFLMVIGIIYAIFGALRQAFSGPSPMVSPMVVLVWVLVPLILQMAFLKTFTARYLFFCIVPLLIFVGCGLEVAKEKVLRVIHVTKLPSILAYGLILAVSIPALKFDYLLLTNPEKSPLPREERIGYLETWTAGYGFPEIASFLIEKKQNGPVVVGTEGYFGTLPDGLAIYLDKAEITILGGTSTISAKLRDAAKTNQTYFVGNSSRVGSNLGGAEVIKVYPKAKPLDNNVPDAVVLYKVLPE